MHKVQTRCHQGTPGQGEPLVAHACTVYTQSTSLRATSRLSTNLERATTARAHVRRASKQRPGTFKLQPAVSKGGRVRTSLRLDPRLPDASTPPTFARREDQQRMWQSLQQLLSSPARATAPAQTRTRPQPSSPRVRGAPCQTAYAACSQARSIRGPILTPEQSAAAARGTRVD